MQLHTFQGWGAYWFSSFLYSFVFLFKYLDIVPRTPPCQASSLQLIGIRGSFSYICFTCYFLENYCEFTMLFWIIFNMFFIVIELCNLHPPSHLGKQRMLRVRQIVFPENNTLNGYQIYQMVSSVDLYSSSIMQDEQDVFMFLGKYKFKVFITNTLNWIHRINSLIL